MDGWPKPTRCGSASKWLKVWKQPLLSGLLHRDVKPGNILFTEQRVAKVADFGLAVRADGPSAQADIWGTPYYLAPEALLGQGLDVRGDIYSLGATIYHALTGRPVFEATTSLEVAQKQVHATPLPVQTFAPETSGSTAYVIAQMLQKDPSQRQQSYGEVLSKLRFALSELERGSVARQTLRKPAGAVVEKEQRVVAWVTALVLAILLIGAVVFMRPAPHPAPMSLASSPRPAASTEPEERLQPPQDAALDAAMLLLGKADYNGAAQLCGDIANRKGISEPLLHWSLILKGVAQLMSNDDRAAKLTFQELAEHLPKGKPANQALAFFATLAAAGKSDPGAPVEARFDDGYASIGFLVIGMKQWAAGNQKEAVPLLRSYRLAHLPKEAPWLGRLQAAASGFIDLYTKNQNNGAAIPGALGWADLDIGSPGIPGSASYNQSTDVWTVSGGGSDIYASSDQFNFASLSGSGDAAIVAEVASIENTSEWAKAGLMFRDSTSPDSIYVAVVATQTYGVFLHWRDAAGASGIAYRTVREAADMPHGNSRGWLKLVKHESTFTCFYSPDGTNWYTGPSVTMPFTNRTWFCGLAVTSHDNGRLNTSTFRHVSFLLTPAN